MNISPAAVVEPRKVEAGRGYNWLVEAFDLFKQAPGTWIGIGVIYLVIIIVASLIPGASLLTTLFGPVFTGGLILACDSQHSGRGVEIKHLFAGFSGGRFGDLVLLSVIYIAAMIVVMIIGFLVALLGFGLSPAQLTHTGVPDNYILPLLLVLLIVLALFIPVMMGMWLAPALIVLRGIGPVTAFKLSFNACLINLLPFLVYGIVALVLVIVASIPLLLGLLVAMPVLFISNYTAYRDMFPVQPDFAATQPIPVPPPL